MWVVTYTPYTLHLLEFDRRASSFPELAWLLSVDSPLVWQEWARDLATPPGPGFRYLHSGGDSKGVTDWR